MKCSRCGKEIPDGEEKVCEDCQKALMEEIAEQESKVSAKKEEKAKKETKKAEKKEKDKTASVAKANKIGTIIAVLLCIAIVVAIVMGCLNYTSSNTIGNSIGNIRNYGYAASRGDTIFYLSPNEDSSLVGIYSIKTNGSNKKELYMAKEDEDILSINVLGNHVYFILISVDSESEDDKYDNNICRMKLDGSDFEILNNNEFSNDCYEIYVLGNKIYYIDTANNIATMNLDGSEREVLVENGTGYLGITEKYIIFNKDNEDQTDYITYIMDIDGTNERPIIDNTRLYSVNVSADDYVYYTDKDLKICRTKLGSNKAEILYDGSAYNLNYYEGNLYFLNYKDAFNVTTPDYTVCVFKLSENGGTPEIVKELANYSSYLDVTANGVIYMDSDSEDGYINYINLETLEEVRIYDLNYEEYYNNLTSSLTSSGSDTTTTAAEETFEEEVTEPEEFEEPTAAEAAAVAEPVTTETTEEVTENVNN